MTMPLGGLIRPRRTPSAILAGDVKHRGRIGGMLALT